MHLTEQAFRQSPDHRRIRLSAMSSAASAVSFILLTEKTKRCYPGPYGRSAGTRPLENWFDEFVNERRDASSGRCCPSGGWVVEPKAVETKKTVVDDAVAFPMTPAAEGIHEYWSPLTPCTGAPRAPMSTLSTMSTWTTGSRQFWEGVLADVDAMTDEDSS